VARARTGRAAKVRKAATLGVLALAAIDVASVVSARNLPMMSVYGWSMLALFLFSILIFLVPISMAAAELGTGWPEDGGVYAWVKQAFGGRTGFLAVWCDYAENVPWFPTVLSFMAASLAYAFDPALANNKLYLVIVMLTFFWGTTALNLRGVEASTLVAGVGTVLGSILPALLVVGLGIAWLADGKASQIPFSADALVPDVALGNLAFLGGIILLFTGMEMAGFHARETRDPGRTVPRAIFLSVGVIVLFSVLGSLFLAFVIPAKELSLVSGTMELFRRALDGLGIGFLLKPLALLVALGGIAHLSPWILGPAKGVGAVARGGDAPPSFGRTNDRDVPVGLLIAQGIGGSVFSLLFLLVPSVSTSYWMLSAVTAQIIAVMYGLMFAAVIRLRYTQPDTPRPYRIPGGRAGVWLAGGLGIVGCTGSLILGFVPPDQLKTGDPVLYVLLLAAATVVLCLPPFLWAGWERRRARVRLSPQPSLPH
jgi:amino acid transporter